MEGNLKMRYGSSLRYPGLTAQRRRLIDFTATEWMFFAFAIFLLVGGTPFLVKDSSALDTASGEGDPIRQVFYISIMLLSFIPVVKIGVFNALRGVPLALLALCLWCLVTVPFAVDPSASFRRWVLAIVLIVTIVNLLTSVGIERTLVVVRAAITTLIIVSLITVPIVPGAVHGEFEGDHALIGAWKGAFVHKNHASAVTALGLIMYVHEFVRSRKKWAAAMLVLGFIFLLGTKGKSALGLALPSILAGLAYSYCYKRQGGRALFLISGACIVGASLVAFALLQDTIFRIFNDPTSFTGRVRIWSVVFDYAIAHPLFGAGYASFWQVGDISPIFKVGSAEDWLLATSHSHNGYMEILATTGVIGLSLAVLAVVVVPLMRMVSAGSRHANLTGLLFSLWLFGIFYNSMETQILARDKQVWFNLLIVLCSVKVLHEDAVRAGRSRLNVRRGPLVNAEKAGVSDFGHRALN
ncbi:MULTISPECIES: O-antigen ligase family protein [unclassified Rhizobium]|uniref:O-antigen ligase family protein n=1 Tax=unclassified Rhizobium TaxID=2613769 RepID=UPI000EA99B4D|nr:MULTISPECIES: O-antigen ligase family protein [unclassified Rhizobium]AYG70167.1 O-antigen ligase family protein [Rhizobium sp. CCGE531]AYG76542.1 O-antigen ligase family protein [Rhizobium sp. CCGE532]